jgi:hypothetical protein
MLQSNGDHELRRIKKRGGANVLKRDSVFVNIVQALSMLFAAVARLQTLLASRVQGDQEYS